jgi:hypothetical protein
MQADAAWRRALECARATLRAQSVRARGSERAMMTTLGDIGWVLFFVGFAWEFVIRPLLR